MARIHNIIRRSTQLLALFCKYSRTLQVLRRKSWSSMPKSYSIIYRYLYNVYYHGQKLCAPTDDIMNLKQLRRVLRATIPSSSMSRFILDFKDSKPNSFSTMAKITPTMSLVVEVTETSENPMQSSLFTQWELYVLHYLLLRFMRHITNCRTVSK